MLANTEIAGKAPTEPEIQEALERGKHFVGMGEELLERAHAVGQTITDRIHQVLTGEQNWSGLRAAALSYSSRGPPSDRTSQPFFRDDRPNPFQR